jgi:hypothetical protein
MAEKDIKTFSCAGVIGGNEVTTPFMVTEVYIQLNGSWKLGSLSFSRLLTSPGE